MSERITETRFAAKEIAVLIELNSAILILLVGMVAVPLGDPFITVVSWIAAALSAYIAVKNTRRGFVYRIADRLGDEPDWTLNDVDTDKLRENGYVIINE